MLRPGQVLVVVTIALLTFGVVMVSSASLSLAEGEGVSLSSILTGRPMLYAVIAAGMLIAGAFTPLRTIFEAKGARSIIPWLVLAILGSLALVHVPGLSREVNGSSRWLSCFGVSFQPSELAKWGIIIVLGWHGARHAGSMHRMTVGFLPPIWLLAIICVLIAVEDLGTAILIGVVALAMLVTAGVRLWQAALIVPVGIAGFVVAVLHSPYRITRLMTYLDPFQDPQDSGYQIIQSMAAIVGGDITGRGLGNGLRKFGYLPEDTTDFIFAVICEELGVFGAAMVIFLYAAFVVAAFMVIRRAVHQFERLVATGVMLTLGLQAAINIAVVTGVAPTKGIALPLLSHGGTGWALTAFSIGLLVSIDRESERAESRVRAGQHSTAPPRLIAPT